MRGSAELAVGLLRDPSKVAEFNGSQAASAMSRLEKLKKSEKKFKLIVTTNFLQTTIETLKGKRFC